MGANEIEGKAIRSAIPPGIAQEATKKEKNVRSRGCGMKVGLLEIWERHESESRVDWTSEVNTDFLGNCYLAILCWRMRELERARLHMRRAVAVEPQSVLGAALSRFLKGWEGVESKMVYTTARGFRRFIRGGGNIPLYRNLVALLRAHHETVDGLRLLDIGAGDGQALLPSLPRDVGSVDVVEPSVAMASELEEALERKGVTHRVHRSPVQDFVNEVNDDQTWDVVQATYSMHTLPPEERKVLLQWLRRRAGSFLVAEFDVPDIGVPWEPAGFDHFVERYERGIAEYAAGPDRDVVAQEFLIPVFMGNMRNDSNRLTFEQPIKNWAADLKAAGFANVEYRFVARYWWADSYLLSGC